MEPAAHPLTTWSTPTNGQRRPQHSQPASPASWETHLPILQRAQALRCPGFEFGFRRPRPCPSVTSPCPPPPASIWQVIGSSRSPGSTPCFALVLSTPTLRSRSYMCLRGEGPHAPELLRRASWTHHHETMTRFEPRREEPRTMNRVQHQQPLAGAPNYLSALTYPQ